MYDNSNINADLFAATAFSVPVIEFLSPNQTGVKGSTIVLHCNARGYPLPSITWIKQGNDSVLSTNNTLTLSQSTIEDAGLYICTAINHKGNDTKTFFVDVQCKLKKTH